MQHTYHSLTTFISIKESENLNKSKEKCKNEKINQGFNFFLNFIYFYIHGRHVCMKMIKKFSEL